MQEALRIITTYSDVFARDGDSLGRTTAIQHRIATCEDVPVNQRHRRIPPNQLTEVKEHLQDLLEKGVINRARATTPHRLSWSGRKMVPCVCVWTTESLIVR